MKILLKLVNRLFATLFLLVSLGLLISGCASNGIKVPNLYNYDRESASSVASGLGLVPFVAEEFSEGVDAGWVISTVPKAGSNVEPSSVLQIFVSKGPKPTAFDDAYALCKKPFGVSVSDKGATISIDTRGDEDASGASYSDLFCIIKALETPDYILEGITSVRALDGRQTQNFNNISVWYSYHPSFGSTVVFHMTDEHTG